jgi:hypothetical protein
MRHEYKSSPDVWLAIHEAINVNIKRLKGEFVQKHKRQTGAGGQLGLFDVFWRGIHITYPYDRYQASSLF